MVDILDGAIGTELAARGLRLVAPAWSAVAVRDAPSVLADVHRDYARAGATFHTANTFRTQPKVLGAEWASTLEAAVRIAKSSVPPGAHVLGSLAPVEDCYRPEQSPGAGARATHRAVATALADAGCDAILCETFANGEEALVAVDEALATGLPTWLSLTPGPFGDLLDPAALGAIATKAADAGVARVLVNCVAATGAMPYVRALAEVGVPFGVYANAGSKDHGLGWARTNRSLAERYADLAEDWVDAGAGIVGGCCGTTPLHIAALSARFGQEPAAV